MRVPWLGEQVRAQRRRPARSWPARRPRAQRAPARRATRPIVTAIADQVERDGGRLQRERRRAEQPVDGGEEVEAERPRMAPLPVQRAHAARQADEGAVPAPDVADAELGEGEVEVGHPRRGPPGEERDHDRQGGGQPPARRRSTGDAAAAGAPQRSPRSPSGHPACGSPLGGLGHQVARQARSMAKAADSARNGARGRWKRGLPHSSRGMASSPAKPDAADQPPGRRWRPAKPAEPAAARATTTKKYQSATGSATSTTRSDRNGPAAEGLHGLDRRRGRSPNMKRARRTICRSSRSGWSSTKRIAFFVLCPSCAAPPEGRGRRIRHGPRSGSHRWRRGSGRCRACRPCSSTTG